MPFSRVVTLDGRPSSNATVKFIPERFLGTTVLPATGTTFAGGRASMAIATANLSENLRSIRGVHQGIYKVEVTHPRKKIGSRYNSQTRLGQEVAQDMRDLFNVTFHLKSH